MFLRLMILWIILSTCIVHVKLNRKSMYHTFSVSNLVTYPIPVWLPPIDGLYNYSDVLLLNTY